MSAAGTMLTVLPSVMTFEAGPARGRPLSVSGRSIATSRGTKQRGDARSLLVGQRGRSRNGLADGVGQASCANLSVEAISLVVVAATNRDRLVSPQQATLW